MEGLVRFDRAFVEDSASHKPHQQSCFPPIGIEGIVKAEGPLVFPYVAPLTSLAFPHERPH